MNQEKGILQEFKEKTLSFTCFFFGYGMTQLFSLLSVHLSHVAYFAAPLCQTPHYILQMHITVYEPRTQWYHKDKKKKEKTNTRFQVLDLLIEEVGVIF